MNKWMVVFALSTATNLCHSAQVHLHCSTLRDAGRVFAFEIDIDRARNEAFVDGQFTTQVFISDYLTSFVLADGNTGYAFDIYANGRLIATNQKDQSTLFMQCT